MEQQFCKLDAITFLYEKSGVIATPSASGSYGSSAGSQTKY